MIARLPREWRWVLVLSALVLIVSSIPILAGYLAQTETQRFAGAVYDVQDYFSHLARMHLGARGEYAYRSLFTPEAHRSQPMVYNDIVLGGLAALFGLPFPMVYEMSRLLGGLLMLLAVYQFIATALPDIPTRRLAFVMAIVSSGFGWFLLLLPAFQFPNQSPIEFWLADGYLFFSVMGFHHFGWSIAALLASFMAWQAYVSRPRSGALFWLAAFSLLLGLNQVFELILLDAVIGVDSVYRLIRDRRMFRPLALAGVLLALLHFLVAWPYLYALQTSPFFQVWLQQNRTLSPPPHYFLLGFGLLCPLAFMGLAWAWRRREARLAFPALWLGVTAILIYSPTGTQYRWLAGVSVAAAIFAAVGLESVLIPFVLERVRLRGEPNRLKWWIAALTILATTPSTLYLVAGNTLLAATHWEEAFFTRGQVMAMDWLATYSEPDDTVLAWLKVGNAIPGRIGHRVFVGHWAETMNFAEKGKWVKEFFSGMPDDQRRLLLREYQVRFVFHGPDERKLGEFDPGAAPYLAVRYQNEDTAVYEVRDP